jgi:hypothetical protein
MFQRVKLCGYIMFEESLPTMTKIGQNMLSF